MTPISSPQESMNDRFQLVLRPYNTFSEWWHIHQFSERFQQKLVSRVGCPTIKRCGVDNIGYAAAAAELSGIGLIVINVRSILLVCGPLL